MPRVSAVRNWQASKLKRSRMLKSISCAGRDQLLIMTAELRGQWTAPKGPRHAGSRQCARHQPPASRSLLSPKSGSAHLGQNAFCQQFTVIAAILNMSCPLENGPLPVMSWPSCNNCAADICQSTFDLTHLYSTCRATQWKSWGSACHQQSKRRCIDVWTYV